MLFTALTSYSRIATCTKRGRGGVRRVTGIPAGYKSDPGIHLWGGNGRLRWYGYCSFLWGLVARLWAGTRSHRTNGTDGTNGTDEGQGITMNAPATAADLTRFHLSLNVNNLGKAVHFLSALLGCPPKKQRADYAKFEPEDLPIVLSLEPRPTPQPPLRNTAGEGPLNHAGIRMTDAAQLIEVQRRLEAAGYSTQREEGVECCYARQTKFWVHDHDRTIWEVYVLEEDLEHRGGQHDVLHSHRTVETDSAAPRKWTHRLSEEFPDIIPGAGELDEVLLQGTWNAERHRQSWASQLQQVYTALRPNGKLILHILTANQRIEELQPLSGPAAVVQVVPLLADVLSELDAAGFVDVQFLKYESSPCFTQGNAEMRETRLEAYTAVTSFETQETIRVMYKGPLARVVDDSGATFDRGKCTLIPSGLWKRIASSPMSESFVKLAEPSFRAVSCGIGTAKSL